MSLDELGIRHNTDKASRYTRRGQVTRGHDYLRHYEAAIAALPRPPAVVLDLGIGPPPSEFASARMWADFLPDASIISVDIREPSGPVPDRVTFRRGDLSDAAFLVELGWAAPDLTVEDGSHRWHDQVLSLLHLLPATSSLYIWEDLHVSRPDLAPRFARGTEVAPVDLLDDLVREHALYHHTPRSRTEGKARPMVARIAPLIDSITVIGEAAIFRRR